MNEKEETIPIEPENTPAQEEHKGHLELTTDTAQNIAYICIGYAGASVALGFLGAWMNLSDTALFYLLALLPLGFGGYAVGGKLANNLGEGIKSFSRGWGAKK
jgi:hypothetical protein